MDPDTVTAEAVHGALHAVRYAKKPGETPLIWLDTVTLRLREEGHGESTESRQWMLGQVLSELIAEQLALRRGQSSPRGSEDLTVDRELALLKEDFAEGSIIREAWSMLWFRFIGGVAEPMRVASEAVSVPQRTLRRRVERGCEALAELLRSTESEASLEDARLHNLPSLFTRFVGRQKQISRVRQLLAQQRFVTLTGIGGIGKTRLAIEVARAESGSFSDGAWFVSVAPLGSADLLPSAVASVLNIREETRTPLAETVAQWLQTRSLLLVLDGCELIAPQSGEYCESLLTACPGLRILVTSQQRLGVTGEAALMVPPLAVPPVDCAPQPNELQRIESVELFVDRASVVMPQFALDERNAEYVAEVCRALEGNPLATELAASRIRVLSARDLAARLGQPFDVIIDSSSALRPRQETLRATMDWSHALLSEEERVLLRRLSVFSRGWIGEAAAAVCAGEDISPGETLDFLGGLVDKSLVNVRRRRRERRYHMLETVRQYAEAQLEASGEVATVRERHLAWFADYAIRLAEHRSRHSRRGLAEAYSREDGNFRAALEWGVTHPEHADSALALANALVFYWETTGNMSEGRTWLSRLVRIAERDASLDAERLRALAVSAGLAFRQRDYAEADRLNRKRVALARGLGDGRAEAAALSDLGEVADARGHTIVAGKRYSEALEQFEAIGDSSAALDARISLAAIQRNLAECEAASSNCHAALEQARAVGDRSSEAEALRVLGELACDAGDVDAARDRISECLRIHQSTEDRAGVACALEAVGRLERTRGDALRAAICAGAAVSIRESANDTPASLAEDGLRALERDLRDELGEEAFESAFAEGAALDLDEAVAHALDQAR